LVRVGPAVTDSDDGEALFVNPDHVAAIYPSRRNGETTIRLANGEELFVSDTSTSDMARHLNGATKAK
jgi:uncharacterized protein YlzI (FlbEa/FlbD family)